MKKEFTCILLTGLFLIIISCKKNVPPVIQVRVNNKYSEAINKVVVGPDSFGTVNMGQITSYMVIPEGHGNVFGIGAKDGDTLGGSYSFTGSSAGTYDFTITITATGTVTLTTP